MTQPGHDNNYGKMALYRINSAAFQGMSGTINPSF